jgi:iron complex transport system substrate-binding protein
LLKSGRSHKSRPFGINTDVIQRRAIFACFNHVAMEAITDHHENHTAFSKLPGAMTVCHNIDRFRSLLGWAALVLVGWFWVQFPVSAQAEIKIQPHQVTDPIGRVVSVPRQPQRVVALAPSVTEIIFALERQDILVGVTRFSDFPEAARALPKVGSYVQLDVERIVALRPDLCIGIRDGNPLAAVAQLEALGIPVFAVDPRGLDTVIQSVAVIGQLLNAQTEAENINTSMRRRIDQVKTGIANATRKPRVFFQIGVSPIVSVGSETFIHELIHLAGGINVSAGPAPYPRYSKEQVIDLAPDVIVISSMDRMAVFEQVKAEWEKWPAIPAVKHKSVFIAPSNLFDRPTPRLVDGLELLAGLIHPELFPDRKGDLP